jgi:hypothetical protein
MPFCNSNKVNKLIFLKYKLYFVLLYLFKTIFINLVKYNTVLLCAFIINKKVRLLINLIKYTFKFSLLVIQKSSLL